MVEQIGFMTTEERKKRLDKERAAFVRRWKTFFDRTGGIAGLRGYLTLLHHLAWPYLYFELFIVFLVMGLICNMFDGF